jgi:hypothetical protein
VSFGAVWADSDGRESLIACLLVSEVPYDAPGDGSQTRWHESSADALPAQSPSAAQPAPRAAESASSFGQAADPAAPPSRTTGSLVPQQAGPPPERPQHPGVPEGPSRGFGPPPVTGPQDVEYDEFGLPRSPIPGPRFGESPIGGPVFGGAQPGGAQPGGPGPQFGGPQFGGPQFGGPQFGGPQFGGRPSPGAQQGGPPQHHSDQPISDHLISDQPISGTPASAHPVSGQPVSGHPRHPVSGPPEPAFDVRPSWEPRIVPSPPPQRGKLIVGLLAGLAAGLLIFGVTGYFVGRASTPQAAPTTAPTASTAPADPALSVYEAAQQAANKGKFTPALEKLAAPWLPYVGSCVRDPVRLPAGEKARVRCEHGDVVFTFVEYASVAERDKVRISNLSKNVDARALTPGVVPQREGASPSGNTTGDYVEYAYTVPSGKATLPVAAVWWDDASAPVGAYMIAFWTDKLGGSWDPLRGLWSEHA